MRLSLKYPHLLTLLHDACWLHNFLSPIQCPQLHSTSLSLAGTYLHIRMSTRLESWKVGTQVGHLYIPAPDTELGTGRGVSSASRMHKYFRQGNGSPAKENGWDKDKILRLPDLSTHFMEQIRLWHSPVSVMSVQEAQPRWTRAGTVLTH